MKTSSLLRVFLLSVPLAACATGAREESTTFTPAVITPGLPVERVYNQALDSLLAREYVSALGQFSAVEGQYPYSIWARRALLRQAFIQYQLGAYLDAQSAIERFIQLYPADEAAPYAHYLFAICLYEQTGDVSRSAEKAGAALEALSAVVNLFPETPYARDARVKAVYVRSSLAAREMRTGRYYMWRNFYPGALRRFQKVVREYGNTIYAPEALHRLVEINLYLGLEEEARRSAAMMSHNFPASIWYKRTYALFERVDSRRDTSSATPRPVPLADATPIP